jgi:hypothetical protein
MGFRHSYANVYKLQHVNNIHASFCDAVDDRSARDGTFSSL